MMFGAICTPLPEERFSMTLDVYDANMAYNRIR